MSGEDQDIKLEDEKQTFFILLKDHDGVILTKSFVVAVVNVVRRSNSFRALKGSLFKLVHCEDESDSFSATLLSVENPHHCLQKCDLKDFRKLSKEEYDILFAVPTSNQRYDVINLRSDGKSQLEEACNAKVGDRVKVESEKGGETKEGVLQFIGVGPSKSKTKKGVYFGVIFEQAIGDSDGNLGETNSPCDKNLFYFPVHKINFLSEDNPSLGCKKKERLNNKNIVEKSNQRQHNLKEKSDNSGENWDKSKPENKLRGKQNTLPRQNSKKDKKKKHKVDLQEDLLVGTRVVCFLNDSNPIHGIIRYLDNIANEGIMAGVELDIKPPTKLGCSNYHKHKKIFDCEYGKGLIVKPDTLMKEEEYIVTNEKTTYVTVNDRHDGSTRHELEKKEVKPSEVKSIDPYEEQRELFKKLEEKKHASLNIAHTQNYHPPQHDESREKNIECEIRSHDQGIQGIKNDFDIKTPNNKVVPNQKPQNYSDQRDTSINVGTPNKISSETVNMNLKRQNIPEKKEEKHISKVSVNECGMQKELPSAQFSLQLGSMVEIMIQFKKYYGVLKWKGVHERYTDTIFAGIELENDDLSGCTNGTFLGKKYFHSPLGRAFFIKLHNCKPDSRFALQDVIHTNKQITCNRDKSIKGCIMPITKLDTGYLGRDKGIQGHYNSCYMDSTLFAMFAYSHVFDVMLNRKRRLNDINEYDTVQTILKEQIVNPLRQNGFVGHPSVLELRKCLNELGNIGGFMTEEKDPEEFIVLLFEKVLKVDPFVKLRVNDREEVSHLYQIFFPKEERNPLPSVQYLLEYSFLTSNLQLAEVPSVMILQMPRFGQQKLYRRVQITSKLDITPLLADAMHACVICGQSASSHCPDCACLLGWEIVHTYLCESCWNSVHKHPRRCNHRQPVPIKSLNYTKMSTPDHVLLELFAVVCIEKSHYVTFVKCGDGEDEKWLFFDSMADRVGGENGHNIPEVTMLDTLKHFLNGNPQEISELDKKSNEQIMRVFDDSSLCFYCNKSLTMYR